MILALARSIDPTNGGESLGEEGSLTALLAIPITMLVVTASLAPMIISCFGLVLAERGRRRFAVWMVLMTGLCTGLMFSALLILVHFVLDSGPPSPRLYENAVEVGTIVGSFTVGLLGMVLGVLLVLRFCGYRMTRDTNTASPMDYLAMSEHATAGQLPCEEDVWIASRQRWWRSPFLYLVASLALLGVVLCWPAWIITLANRQAAADERTQEEWKELGADAFIRDGRLESLNLPPGRPISGGLLTKIQESGDVPGMDNLSFCGIPLTDDQLRYLSGLQSLRSLNLCGTKITDAGLEHLRGLDSLQTLELSATQVTDAGLEHLRGLDSLQSLGLSGTQVTDAGLMRLAVMKQLRGLVVNSTRVTAQGVDRFSQAAPHCSVVGQQPSPLIDSAADSEGKTDSGVKDGR